MCCCNSCNRSASNNQTAPNSSERPTATTPHCATPCTITSQTVSTARSNRARTKIGVGERVTLTVSPSGQGPYTWAISGGGTLSSTSGTSVTFTAGDRTSTTTITATGSGCSCQIVFEVVEPDGAYQVQFGNTLHIHGTASAGFRGITYLRPTDVSFENIEINEGNCVAVASGPWASENGAVHPAWPSWATVGGGTDATGSVVQGPNQTGSTYWDYVNTNAGPGPWTRGDFTWPIPWEFRLPGRPKKAFTTLTHYQVCPGASGQVTISKGGVTVSRVPSDSTELP